MMDRLKIDSLAFLDGIPLQNGGCCIISAEWGSYDDDQRSTRLLYFDGYEFEFVDIDANIISLTKLANEREFVVVSLSVDGRIFIVDRKSVWEEHLERSAVGSMTRLFSDEKEVYAVGTAGQIYRRSNGSWVEFDEQVYDPRPTIDAPQLRDITGSIETGLIAVGCFGLILRRENARWSILNVPTNLDLEQIVLLKDELWVCGAHGLLMRGLDEHWTVIDSTTSDNIWGLTKYQDKIYFSTSEHLYLCDDDGLVNIVDFNLNLPISLYKLASDRDFLWSFGLTDVLRFDGIAWRKIA